MARRWAALVGIQIELDVICRAIAKLTTPDVARRSSPCYRTRMVGRSEINRYVAALAREFSPRQVVLFGSHASGRATADSDVDLLVIMDRVADGVEKAIEMRRRIPRTFPLDLLVCSKREAARRLAQKDSFFVSVVRNGQTVYEDQR